MLPARKEVVNPLDFVQMGIAVIPVLPFSKRPAVRWHRYRATGGELPSARQFQRWFRPGRLTNAAVVCGWQQLTILDFDAMASYETWLTWAADRGGAALELAACGYRVRTSRGMHVYVHSSDRPGCSLLWRAAEAERRWLPLLGKDRTARERAAVAGDLWGDIKGIGGLATIPPSVHSSGVPYLAENDGAPIPRVECLADVVPHVAAPRPVTLPGTPSIEEVLSPSSAWSPWLSDTASPIERIKRSVAILDLFPDARPAGGAGRYWVTRCPWHDDREPSLSIDTERGTVRCWTGCTGDKGWDVIDVWARCHGVSNREAIRQLGLRTETA